MIELVVGLGFVSRIAFFSTNNFPNNFVVELGNHND
jgi:hypothetical protein